MSKFLPTLKKIIFDIGLSPTLDQCIYRYRRFKNKGENNKYSTMHPSEKIPPDYYLYETFQIHYKNFFEQGKLTAQEIFEWCRPYLSAQTKQTKILEWGCGVARVCRYIRTYFTDAQVFGCDINNEMIEWDEKNIDHVSFSLISYDPPTHYEEGSFDFVYGLSVFTHIEDTKQEDWLKEIQRILNKKGVFLFSTHGKKYNHQLTPSEIKLLRERGAVTKSYYQKGHRLMGTYNQASHFRTVIEKYFDVLEYYDGQEHVEKLGGQDMWIVRKKDVPTA